MKSLLVAALLCVLPAFAQADDAALVVAGRGASLEQALAQPHAANYRLLVLREELLRLRANAPEEQARALLKDARRRGAVVFVCERDLRAEKLQRSDLVPGVVSIAAASDWVNGTPTQADVALRELCQG